MIASGAFAEDTAAPFRVDGKLYAVPLSVNSWIVLYNTKIFKDAGIEEPKTWDELIAVADKLKAAGITPFVATVQDGWRGFIWFEEIMIRTNPKAYLGLHDGTVPYDGPEVRKVFEIWSDMYAKGYFSDPRSNQEAQDFAGGKGAMYLIGDWAVGLVKNAGMKVGDDFSAFIMPNIDPALPSAAISESGPVVVSVAGKEKPDVMTALNFWISEDAATKWGAVSDNFIGNRKATPPNAIVSKIGSEMAEQGTVAILRWWESVPAEIQSELVAEMNSFMLDPTMENAEGVMQRMQAVNKQYWDSR
jgi:multiple sugar transport system substrate-binding protein